MTERHRPAWSELRPLLRFERPDVNRHQARLARAVTIGDLREIARRRTPKLAFDYTDGAAEAEIGIHRARQTFRNLEFQPRVLRDVSSVTLSTTVAGQPSALPFGIAPTGFTRLMHTEGELAGIGAAATFGIPFTLSTMGTVSLEEVAAAAPQAHRWFQLYLWKDRDKSLALVQRAENAGYDSLVLTVDTAVGGSRLRDLRNGMTIPPRVTARTVLDAARKPQWWVNFFTTPPPAFASLDSYPGSVQALINEMFDPTVSFSDLRWLRDMWNGKLVIKGVQTVDDAVRCVDHGADAVWLSNHGGRQLDRGPQPLRTLPAVAEALDGTGAEIYLDTDFLTGGDIVAAHALGADFAFIGRAYLYGLMAGGQAGVGRAIEILRDEVTRTLQLLGVPSIDELSPDHVKLRVPSKELR